MADAEVILESLLDELKVDWCDVGWAFGLAVEEAGLAGDAARDAAIDALDRGLVDGLLVAGDLGPGGFQPWPERGAAAGARIRDAWHAQGQARPDGSAIGWLEITDRGRAR
ncbi:hypothetical protein [Nocardioides sp. LML1-1-1.1]|uniref:hypothetical protein n=1 Tax=Nocardioides sp. LML1-1-1.1 TaxID=3135248 RepID=UPI0034218FE4